MKRLPRWSLVLFLVFIAVLAIAWSYAWVRARDFTLARFEGWLAAEAQAGRAHQCGNRHASGYPLHVAIICDAPVFNLDDNGALKARFFSLKIAVPLYSPYRATATLGSPFIVTQGDKEIVQVAFARARMNLRHDGHAVTRLALAGNEVVIELGERGRTTARHARFDLRPAPPVISGAVLQDFELTFTAADLLTPGSLPDQPMDVSLKSTIHNWPRWQGAPRPTLDEWRKADGRIEVSDFRIKRNGGLFFMSGETSFNADYRADGRFNAVFVNSPALLRGLIMQGDNDAGVMFGPLLLMLGKQVEFEGNRATSMQLKVNNGVLGFGSMVLGEFPPLY